MGAGASGSRFSSQADVKEQPERNKSVKKNDQARSVNPKSIQKSDQDKPESSEAKIQKDESKKENKDKEKGKQSKEIDVMISYSHADTDFMKKIKAGLEECGMKVWVDITGLKAGVDFLNKIGQAIIDAKMFIQLLSSSSIKSKYCQDELALAYISNKPIFPVGMQKPKELFPEMDTGMKLQLARFNWNLFTDDAEFTQDLHALVDKLKTFKDHGKMETSLDRDKNPLKKGNSRTQVNRHLQTQTSFSVKVEMMTEVQTEPEDDNFWVKNFQNKTAVPWTTFVAAFKKQYQKSLTMMFSAADQEWLERIIHRELSTEDDEDADISREAYDDFCTVDEETKSFWDRVQDQAVESYTMKEVFDMNSSVRVEAIENLGKFRSKAVIEALKDLLHDKDNNIRAVAAISLARTGENSPDVIKELMKCLNDSDRLVREGACLALGHLKAFQAVKKILHLWRNDFISSVREAAQVALELIGGPEANKAMYITKVLSEEIRMLTKE